MKLFASLTAVLGEFIASVSSGACLWGYWDEEECPESLLK